MLYIILIKQLIDLLLINPLCRIHVYSSVWKVKRHQVSSKIWRSCERTWTSGNMWWAWPSRKSSRSRRRVCVRGPREGTETKSSSISSIWPSKFCSVEIREGEGTITKSCSISSIWEGGILTANDAEKNTLPNVIHLQKSVEWTFFIICHCHCY